VHLRLVDLLLRAVEVTHLEEGQDLGKVVFLHGEAIVEHLFFADRD